MSAKTQSSSEIQKTERLWYILAEDEVCKNLKTSATKGLSKEEAQRRFVQFGPNEIEKEVGLSRWQILLHQFKDPLIYILVAAAFVTLILQDYIDSAVITAVVLLNALIGYIQENKAQKAIQSLSKLSDPRVKVLREGHEMEIPSRSLVPGDIVLLSSGARVAADMRLLKIKTLDVDESALTGESTVIRKQVSALETEGLVPADQNNMVFAGTIISRGRAKAVVVRTGGSTELGKIATTVRDIGESKTPLQEKVDKLGTFIGYVIMGFAVIITAIGILYQMDPSEIFITVVAMAVSAIPEGLPVVLTVTLAIGVQKMANRRAIIRSLPAVETLGSTTVIGSDKTGTLTKNQMTVRQIWADNTLYQTTEAGYQLEGSIVMADSKVLPKPNNGLYNTLLAGTLANEVNVESVESGEPQGDPTEIALHVSAYKGGIRLSEIRLSMQELDQLPFEPERKFMGTLNDTGERKIIFLKGAPEVILDKCSRILVEGEEAPIDRGLVRSAATKMAKDGLRVLAMAYRTTNIDDLDDPSLFAEDFTFAGLQGMEDPIRPEVVEAVEKVHQSGIKVIMITGDHLETAVAIGRQLGLDANKGALEGIFIDQLSDEELDQRLRDCNIFARVTPEHKFRIVNRLKSAGEVVAVTGDGINDAPALQAAHLGIAMGKSGTDVAREASDMVLSDDNFATITSAIEEGRIVFSNIRKVTFFLLSTAVGELIVIFAAVLMNWPLPFIAVQILWINLVTNGLQDIALAFEPGEPGIIRRKPRPPDEGILTTRLIERLGGVGMVLAAGTLATFWWTYNQYDNLEIAQTAAMTQMVVFQFFHVFNCRSLDRSIFRINFFSNKFLFISVIAALVAHLGVLHIGFMQTIFRTVPLSIEQWLGIVLVGVLVVIGGEIDKIVNIRRKNFIG
ncbi:MAG: cation-translocating P-type ATPase [Bacteroidota bacterium]